MEIVFGILMGMFALYILVMCFVNLGKAIHSLFNQARWKEGASPDPDAAIVSINSQQVKYVKNGAKFKTTVTFSDGFTFTTHKTNRVNHFGSYTISVDKREVAQMAKDAHSKAVEKKLEKTSPAPMPEEKTVAKPPVVTSADPVNNHMILPADPVEAFQPKEPTPPADDYPKTVPVNQPKPPVDDYPTTAPVTQPKSPVTITPAPDAKPESKPETARWVCPRCGLVHSKTLPVCFHCGTEQIRANKFV